MTKKEASACLPSAEHLPENRRHLVFLAPTEPVVPKGKHCSARGQCLSLTPLCPTCAVLKASFWKYLLLVFRRVPGETKLMTLSIDVAKRQSFSSWNRQSPYLSISVSLSLSGFCLSLSLSLPLSLCISLSLCLCLCLYLCPCLGFSAFLSLSVSLARV